MRLKYQSIMNPMVLNVILLGTFGKRRTN
jgi:hypothetical protein